MILDRISCYGTLFKADQKFVLLRFSVTENLADNDEVAENLSKTSEWFGWSAFSEL